MCSDRFSRWNYFGGPKSPPEEPRPTRPQQEPPKSPSLREVIDTARAAGQDALGLANDPDIEDVLKTLQRKRNEKGMQSLAAALIRLARNYREFSLKVGKKSGVFVTEISVPPFGSAASSSRSLDYAVVDAEQLMRQKIDPHGVLTALDERDLDSAVTELEDIGDDDTF